MEQGMIIKCVNSGRTVEVDDTLQEVLKNVQKELEKVCNTLKYNPATTQVVEENLKPVFEYLSKLNDDTFKAYDLIVKLEYKLEPTSGSLNVKIKYYDDKDERRM